MSRPAKDRGEKFPRRRRIKVCWPRKGRRRRPRLDGLTVEAAARPAGRGPRSYGTPVGTTLMLLNGEPLINFILTTV
jgi:hypothetical protein